MIDLTRNKWWGLVLLAVSLGLVASASVVRHTRSNQHDQVAHVDSTVELSCDLSYEYRDDLEWKKLNGRKSDKARAVDGKLVITGLTALDAGEYECFTDYGKSSIVKLTVQPAAGKAQPNAHLAASPMNEFERELDTDVELFCALSRGNENDIKWRKIGGEMSEFNREYDGKVLIYYLSAEDSGEYECYLPTGESRRVVLKVTAPKEYENEYDASSHSNEHHKNVQAQQVFPQENAEAAASEQVSAVYQETRDSEQIPSELIGGETIAANHDKVVDAGANVELSCIYTSSSPDNLKWKKINDKLSDYAREHLGKLYIFYSTPQDAGEYECYLPNGQSAVVKLTVNPVRSANDHQELEGEVVPNDDEPVVEDRKEIVRVEKKVDNFDQVAEHDSNVQLACELTEGHESELKWKKLEGTLSQYGRDHLGKLYIYYVNQHDSGEYECFLPSGEFRRVKLTVNGGQKNEEPVVAPVHHSPAHHVPEDANKNYDLEVELNQHAELDCKHRLGNENTLKWKKLNGEINPYAREHQGKLYIYYASKQDAGVYECYLPSGESSQVNLAIKNDNVEAAQDRSSAVYNEPEVKEQPESAADNQYVLEVEGNYDEVAEINSNVELSCRYINQHQNGLQWKKLDGTLSQYTRVHEGKLFIYYISEQDEGEYECYLPDGSLSRAKLTVNRPAEQTHSLSASSHVQPVAAPHQPASESESGYDVAYASSRENHDKQAEINDNIELTCGLSQSNEDTINWRKIDGEMSDYSRPYAGKLYIYYLKQEDAGDYECSLPNGQSERVRVTVNGGGRNDDAPQEPAAKQSATDDERVHEQEEQSFDKEVEFNTNVELSCKFTQSHAQNLRWRKRDGQLKYNTRESQGKLMIYYANEYNQGDYECYLPNGQSSVVKLTVRDSSASAPAQNTNTYNNPSNYQRSDESYAVRAYVSKSELKLRYGSSDENTCTGMTNGDSMEIKWYNSRGQLLKDDQSIKIKTSLTSQEPLTKVSVFTVLSASSSSVDTIECRVIVGRKIESAKFKVLLDNGRSSYQNSQELVSATKVYNILPLAASRRQFCGVNEATCANGQCIPRTGLCDGRQDCQDGSDENNCSADSSGCQPNERACRNGVCKEKFWFCDGEKDCEDGSDEESCPPARPGETCKPDEFECKSRKQCIKKGFVCDNEFDCEDKSDEIGCQKPSAITFPIRNLRVREGETFTIECQAGGFPEPYINWRKNWGHICKEPRCTTSTRNGFGTLTVRNAQLDDVGAYSCEAMNSQGREFIGPDTLVEIEETYERPQQPREEYEPREDLQPCGEGTTAEYRSGCGEEQTPEPTPAYEESRCGDETTPAEYRSGCGEERTEPPPPPPVEEESRCGEETTPAESRGCGEPEPTQPPPPEVEEESRPCGYEAAEQRSGCGHEQPTYPPPPPEVHEEESRPCGYQETTEAAEQRSGCGHEQPTYPPPPEVHEEESRPCGYQETTEAAEQRSGCGHEEPTYPPPEVQDESHPCGYNDYATPAQSSSCSCNNHSDKCTCGGFCYECQHNTEGQNCERCAPGYYGDATMGTPYDCKPIHSRNSQRFPAEELREPYQAPRRQSCDPDGTATDLGHSCRCKSGVIGTYCDQCAPKHFNMLRAASQQSSSKPSRRGCLSCFCNGLDVDCQSSNLNYEAVTSSFEYGADEWKISDRFTRLKEDVEANENGIEFTRFDEYQDKETDLYFIPSRKFGGNRLSSYGGYLNFSIEYEGVFENFKQLEIRISGNRINIYHVYDATLKPRSKYDITLQLVESEFKRYGDNGRVDRDHFLMTLQNIELIMIRASFVRQQHKVRLSDVSLQHAELNGSMNRASSVEVCRCPIGYTGNSCEDCAPGYRRSKIGFYLGLCEPEYFKY